MGAAVAGVLSDWDAIIGDAADVRMVLFLDTSMEICTQRVMKRAK